MSPLLRVPTGILAITSSTSGGRGVVLTERRKTSTSPSSSSTPSSSSMCRGSESLPLVVTEHATFVARIMSDPWQRSAYRASVRAAARFVAVSRTAAGEDAWKK